MTKRSGDQCFMWWGRCVCCIIFNKKWVKPRRSQHKCRPEQNTIRLMERRFYALSASEAIFRARTKSRNLFSPVLITTWWRKLGGNLPPGNDALLYPIRDTGSEVGSTVSLCDLQPGAAKSKIRTYGTSAKDKSSTCVRRGEVERFGTVRPD